MNVLSCNDQDCLQSILFSHPMAQVVLACILSAKKEDTVINFILVRVSCVGLVMIVLRSVLFFPQCLKRQVQGWRRYFQAYKAV